MKKTKVIVGPKIYVGRTVEDGLPRCWGRTMKDCEKAIQMWLYKQVRNKPIQMWEVDTNYNPEENRATYDPFLGGKKCSVIFQQTEFKYD